MEVVLEGRVGFRDLLDCLDMGSMGYLSSEMVLKQRGYLGEVGGI